MECVVISQRFRRGFTAAKKTELWDRWQRGESLKAIGRTFGKPSSSIYCQLAPHGGIRPSPRHRSRLALTLSEREEISRGIAAHQSARSMANVAAGVKTRSAAIALWWSSPGHASNMRLPGCKAVAHAVGHGVYYWTMEIGQ